MGAATMTRPETDTVTFVSTKAKLWVSLIPPTDTYDATGGRRTTHPGVKARFDGNRFHATPEVAELLEQHPDYGVRFWRLDDLAAPLIGDHSTQVVSGQATVRTRNTTRPPFADWDQSPANRIKEMLANSQVPDPQAALLWEASHRNRGQVVLALTAAIAGRSDTDPEPEPEPAAAAEGFVQPIPDDAGGL